MLFFNSGLNAKKCRAVFGLEQQHLWCAPCRLAISILIQYNVKENFEHFNKLTFCKMAQILLKVSAWAYLYK